MECQDSRRLTGANLLGPDPGAVLEIAATGGEREEAIAAWRRWARALLDAVDWQGETVAVRSYPGGASLAITAPIDALYAACEVNEAAWELAIRRSEPTDGELTERVNGLRAAIAGERNPRLSALAAEAERRGVVFLSDDEWVSVGTGTGCVTFPVAEIPDPSEVSWDRVHDVPVALVTGTNGKTTTVRMLAAIVRAAGLVAGNTSTDGVQVDGRTELSGDYTGGEGARSLLRDRRIEVAILENARGGLLRRGLAIPRARVACVTNVGQDHLGEYGVHDVAALAKAKLIVAHAVREGRLVVPAGDALLAAAARATGVPLAWVRVDGPDAIEIRPDEPVTSVRDGAIVAGYGPGDDRFPVVIDVDRVPATHGGVARHNVANAAFAVALARELGVGVDAIREGLSGFRSDMESNPGRGNLVQIGDLRLWLDFAHNPEGVGAILAMAERLPAGRRLLILGQAGDRTDASIVELGVQGARSGADRILLKRMPKYLRGRPEGEVIELLREGLRRGGYDESRVEVLDSEIAAVREALAWSRPGDLLLLLLHESRGKVLELVRSLQESGWRPGSPLPPEE